LHEFNCSKYVSRVNTCLSHCSRTFAVGVSLLFMQNISVNSNCVRTTLYTIDTFALCSQYVHRGKWNLSFGITSQRTNPHLAIGPLADSMSSSIFESDHLDTSN
jgi:hypothetical protein